MLHVVMLVQLAQSAAQLAGIYIQAGRTDDRFRPGFPVLESDLESVARRSIILYVVLGQLLTQRLYELFYFLVVTHTSS
jgi:hypothetical protein